MSDLVSFNPSRAFDENTDAVAAAQAYFYDTGTLTARVVYSDSALTVPHAVPLLADGSGIFPEVFVGGGPVRAIVKKPDGTTIYDLDPCVKVPSGGAGASTVSFTPTPEIAATNVQDALDLLGQAKSDAVDFMGDETAIGQAIRTAPSTTTAQTALGGTTVGRGVFAAAAASDARTAIGFNDGLNAAGSAPVYAARAWVNFHGTPTNGTYTRTGSTVTVTMTAHGMATGNIATLDYTTGSATDGSYAVTVVDANTFTVTDTGSGVTSGNVTRNAFIRRGGNVASITRNGTGDYTLNFTTALPHADYVIAQSGPIQTSSSSSVAFGLHASGSYGTPAAPTLQTTTAARVQAVNSGGVSLDLNNAYVIVFC